MTASPTDKRHRRVAFGVAGIVLVMGGLSFASVPLYDMFCKVTGYGGTPRVAALAGVERGTRDIVVRLDANVAPGLPWKFEAETTQMTLRTGETATVFYKVRNMSSGDTAGTAAYNVSPDQAGSFFNKIACFCFTEQKLGPGESLDMPVVFFLDPALEKDETMQNVSSVTLSYTFFPVKAPAKVGAASASPKL